MDERTIDAYNQFAQKYDEETSGFWDSFPQTFLNTFIGLVRGKVLDVGSGPGRDGLLLQKHGLEVTCLDASKVMVAMSTKKGLRSVLGDFNAMPFRDESFDGVWAYTSLLHVSKEAVQQPLSEIWRVLKPGGMFGLGLIEGTTEEYRETSKVSGPRWFSYYTKTEVEKLLKQHGFELVHFEQFKPNTRNYLNFIAAKFLTM